MARYTEAKTVRGTQNIVAYTGESFEVKSKVDVGLEDFEARFADQHTVKVHVGDCYDEEGNRESGWVGCSWTVA